MRRILAFTRRWAAFLLLVASLVPALVYRSWIDAQTAAVVVLATTLNTPVLTWLANTATDAPDVEETFVAGQPATLVRPGSGDRWPAIVFANGATEEGRHHREVQRLARGLARAGFLVVVPELPGLRRGEITLRTLAALVAVARATDARADTSRVGFVGVSVGASLALAAAEDDELAGRVSAVAGIAPYADLREVARLATTGSIRSDGRLVRYDADAFVTTAVRRSLAGGLTSRRGRAALGRLLRNRDPRAFDRLWRRLPRGLRTAARRLSPIGRPHRLRMPVELATSPDDKYFPVSESRRLVRVAPNAHLTVTATLSHALPEPSPHAVGAALRFDGFVVRGLRALRG